MGNFHWALTVLVSLILVASVLSSGLMFYEHFHVKTLDGNGDYPFGSEEAMAVGGDAYASKEAYLESTLVDGFVLAGISALIAVGVFGKRKWLAVLGALLWVGYLSLQAAGAL